MTHMPDETYILNGEESCLWILAIFTTSLRQNFTNIIDFDRSLIVHVQLTHFLLIISYCTRVFASIAKMNDKFMSKFVDFLILRHGRGAYAFLDDTDSQEYKKETLLFMHSLPLAEMKELHESLAHLRGPEKPVANLKLSSIAKRMTPLVNKLNATKSKAVTVELFVQLLELCGDDDTNEASALIQMRWCVLLAHFYGIAMESLML